MHRFDFSLVSRGLSALCLASTLALAVPVLAEDSGTMLFSLEEAEELSFSADELSELPGPLRSRGSTGPQIELQSPPISDLAKNTIEITSPADLRIAFAPREADVDMGSLQVKAKKGMFSKSLTKTLAPYIAGTEIQADGIELPTGRFVIVVVIADLDGETSEEEYRLVVSD